MNLACFNSASFVTTSGLGISVSPTVEVRREDTSALASIFSDEAGTTPITNPSAFADSVGRFKFYAAGLARGYSILVTKGAESFTLRNVAIGTAGQMDAGYFAAPADVAAAAAAAAADVDAVEATVRRQNLLINGNWLIDQIYEGAVASPGGSLVQAQDGWSVDNTGTSGGFTTQIVADPDNAALKALKIACTTADTSIAAGDNYYIVTAIEGYDVADLNAGLASASAVTLRFKFKSNLTGVYGISVANGALNRSYVGIITVPNTSENEYTLTLTLDTAGTWLYTNGVGLYLRICLAAGSTFQKAAGTWGADNMFTTSAQANFMSVNTNVAYLKRIQLVPGSVVLVYGPQDIQNELAKCQRYYWKTFVQGTAVAQNAGPTGCFQYRVLVTGVRSHQYPMRYTSQMRTTPTFTFYNPSAANANWRNATLGADSGAGGTGISSDGHFTLDNVQVAGDTAGNQMLIHATANARLS